MPGNRASLAGIIRGLHKGKTWKWDVSWAVDIAAVALILLTVSVDLFIHSAACGITG
ncbi:MULTISPECIES: hypothetical protein [Parageobacillus]|uniref:hypothetical protein n=1 Tax=Parageobacillus TaxID=1906945 RepID=UPI001E554456|nr:MULTISPECIES: hypothetical protein [Parageobacillus]BDG48908.1 hypothetical protein PspKH34_34690 [Parageobacillus sp. KH3-4]